MECIGDRGTEIQEFYRGANVLVTGATGFMGKVLLEKLLRSCPHLSNIYLLVRSKKGKNSESRLDEIFDDPIFGKLKDQMPKFRHKVVIVNGDCTLPGLGLETSDRRLLIEDISHVFHCAASVRFDDSLRSALATNVVGTTSVLELVREMKKLKVVIHTSTVYCNCHLEKIDEKFYSYPLTHQNLCSVVDGVNDKMLESITPFLMDKWPNTYAFTKAIAENAVKDQGVGLPIGVFRPAIVVGTRSEPVSGWIDNLYGPTGVFVGAGTGFIKTIHVDGTKIADLVPVDMTVNALIVSAWEVANKPRAQNGDQIPVYNYVSSVQKPLTWDQFMGMTARHGLQVPSMRTMWCYSLTLNKRRSIHLVYLLFLHFIPATIIDGIALLLGKRPKLLKIYKKINKFCDVISYFSTRDWQVANKNVQELWQKLGEDDRKLFDFNMDELDWDKYFYTYVRGIRLYLLKDDASTIPQAVVRYKRLRWIHQGVKFAVLILILRLVWAIRSLLSPQK